MFLFSSSDFKTLGSEDFKKIQNLFFKINIKKTNSPKRNWINFYSNKKQGFPIFSKYFYNYSANIPLLINFQHSTMKIKHHQNISNTSCCLL
jgi:hypothetical protein